MPLRRKLFLAAVSAAVMLHAQTTPPAPDEAPTFTLDAKLVPLHVSVLDKNGKLLTNFPQSAFKVFENNVEHPLKIFNREDVPVSMGIIIDNSGSMREKRPKVAAGGPKCGPPSQVDPFREDRGQKEQKSSAGDHRRERQHQQ